tara:strand:- start:141 stop:1166 length:1026 start_codon:yes stop_codon:yes gene_type:complete
MRILVTGSAGFIGFHLIKRLLTEGYEVIGIDNFNPYYDPKLKRDRNNEIEKLACKLKTSFTLSEINLEDTEKIKNVFTEYKPSIVINLGAQAGVRYSLENPMAYVQSNLVGFSNIVECCRLNDIKHLIYASTSSVYGWNEKIPFSEKDSVDHPVSLYAATKRSNELMAHCYSHLYNLPTTGLRFFTVYGPWGRPDMALFLFTKSILNNEPIKIFNNGQMIRDFTYIDDIIESIFRLINRPPKSNLKFDKLNPDPSTSWTPYRIFNIGNSQPVMLMDYIEALERSLGVSAKKEYLPLQPGDVKQTSSDTSELELWTGFKPKTSINEGILNFVSWYKKYFNYI